MFKKKIYIYIFKNISNIGEETNLLKSFFCRKTKKICFSFLFSYLEGLVFDKNYPVSESMEGPLSVTDRAGRKSLGLIMDWI